MTPQKSWSERFLPKVGNSWAIQPSTLSLHFWEIDHQGSDCHSWQESETSSQIFWKSRKDTTNALENVYNFAKYFPLFPTICRSNTIFSFRSPQLVSKVSSTTRGIMLLHQLVCDWTYCRTQLGFSSTGLSSTNCLPPIILHQLSFHQLAFHRLVPRPCD